MESKNYYYFKYISYILFCFWLVCLNARAQTSYAKYDNHTTRLETKALDSQINYNNKNIESLRSERQNLSLYSSQGSIQRSRIQGLINAKENENFRLNQKRFSLDDSKVVRDKEGLNKLRSEYPLYKLQNTDGSSRGGWKRSASQYEFDSINGEAKYAEPLR